jgi:hypothetical protein
MPREHEGGGRRGDHGLGHCFRSTTPDLVDERTSRRRENSDSAYHRENVRQSRDPGSQFLLFSQQARDEREDISDYDDRQPAHRCDTGDAGTCWRCIAQGSFPPVSVPRSPAGGHGREAIRDGQIKHQRRRRLPALSPKIDPFRRLG